MTNRWRALIAFLIMAALAHDLIVGRQQESPPPVPATINIEAGPGLTHAAPRAGMMDLPVNGTTIYTVTSGGGRWLAGPSPYQNIIPEPYASPAERCVEVDHYERGVPVKKLGRLCWEPPPPPAPLRLKKFDGAFIDIPVYDN